MNNPLDSDPIDHTGGHIFSRRDFIWGVFCALLGGGVGYVVHTPVNISPHEVPIIPTALPPLTDTPTATNTPTITETPTGTAIRQTSTPDSLPGATPAISVNSRSTHEIYDDKLLEASGLILRPIEVTWTDDPGQDNTQFSPRPTLNAIVSTNRVVGFKIRLELQALDRVDNVFASFSTHDKEKDVDVPNLDADLFTQEIMRAQSSNLFGPKASRLPLDYYIMEDGYSMIVDNQPYKNANVLKYSPNWNELNRTLFQAYSSPVLTVEDGNVGLDISVRKNLTGSFQIQK